MNGMKQDSLASSRHNPDFMDRTFPKRLEIEDRISAFRRLLATVVRKGDEVGLEELYSRAKRLQGELLPKDGGGYGLKGRFDDVQAELSCVRGDGMNATKMERARVKEQIDSVEKIDMSESGEKVQVRMFNLEG